MTYNVIISSDAEEDFENILKYLLFEKRSIQAAEHFIDDCNSTDDFLTYDPSPSACLTSLFPLYACRPPSRSACLTSLFPLYACRPPSHPACLTSLFSFQVCRPPSHPAYLTSLFTFYACRPPSHPACLTSLFPLYACRPSAQFYRGHSGKQFKDLNFHKCLTKTGFLLNIKPESRIEELRSKFRDISVSRWLHLKRGCEKIP